MGEKRIFLQENRDRIEKKYQVRCERFPEIFEKINDKLTGCDTDTAAAMKFLYGYMPYSDIGNYDFENFLDYAAHSVALWEKYDRVRELPEDIYMNYILFHRVNEEEIAPCRSLFFEQMSDAPVWLTQKSEKETALEVNYWCTGEATYHTTDERTLPARTVYLRGNGRCGEESVFVVNAMRSIGIPARQVYTPRWSHCDDNHAWVEVYCGGKWYFLGACEAEPILNKGWFTNASSRAMMIHSRWFDKKMPGSEMIVGKAGIETVLNQLERYAKTTELTIRVTDEEEQPVIGLELHFEILNYGEYSTIASAKTDEKGMASLTTGLGSLCISAVYEGNYIDRWINTWEGSECHFVVGADKSQEKTSDIIWRELDFIAPVDTPVNADMPTREQKAESDLRLEKLTARCRNKMENWKNPQLQEFASPDKPMQELRKKMISCLSEKDMDDCRAKVLEEHLVQAASYEGKYPDEVYAEALLCPRIKHEVMTSYRKELRESFSEEDIDRYQNDPRQIWKDIESNISTDPDEERASLITVPTAALKLRTASLMSKKILFAAIARSLGIAARLNPMDDSMEYWMEGEYHAVLPEQVKTSCIMIKKPEAKAEGNQEWQYAHDWTIARRTDQGYVTIQLEGTAWDEDQMQILAESGKYRVITVNRLPNGNIFEAECTFTLGENDTKTIELRAREANLGDMLENIAIYDFALKDEADQEVWMSKLSQGDRKVFVWLEESKEPTEHILNEIFDKKEAFQKHADQLNFIVRTKEARKQPTLARVLRAIDGIHIYYDDFKENINVLGRRMYVDFEKLPFVFMTAGSLNGIYAATGYNVGMADMLMKILE